jgi:hypothetical protein
MSSDERALCEFSTFMKDYCFRNTLPKRFTSFLEYIRAVLRLYSGSIKTLLRRQALHYIHERGIMHHDMKVVQRAGAGSHTS